MPSDSGGGAGSLVSLGGGSIADGPAGSSGDEARGGAPPSRGGQHTPKKKEQSPARLEPRGTGTSSTPPASQAGSEGTAASEGDSGARGGDARLAGRRQRSSFSGNLSGGGGSTAGELLGETGGTTSGGEEEVHRPSHSGAGGSGIICAYGDETRTDEEEDTKAVFSRDSGSPARGGSREGTDARSHSSRGPNGETDSRARGEPISEPREFSETRGASGSVWDAPGGSHGRFDSGRSADNPKGADSSRGLVQNPTGSFSGVISGVAGSVGGSGGHGVTVSSGFGGVGADFRGEGAYSSRRPSKDGVRGAHSSSHWMRKSVRFATTIDDGGQRTGSRGRYSPPPSPPRESRGTRAGREQREDTPPGARGAREDTPPAPGNSVDSGGLGGAIGDARGAILDPRGSAAAMIIAGAAEVMGVPGDVHKLVPGDVMRAGLELDGDPGDPDPGDPPSAAGDAASGGDGDEMGPPDDRDRDPGIPGSVSGGGASSVLGKRDGDDDGARDELEPHPRRTRR